MAVSASEAHYIIESCLADFRADGRARLEHRPYAVANRSSRSRTSVPDAGGAAADVAPTLILSNGSSRVHLPGSATDVLCSVKADLVRPSPARPREGVVELGVDLSLCGGGGGTAVAGGGGAGGGAQRRRRQVREEESQVSSLLRRLVLPHAVDAGKLAVWPGRYVWRLAVDVVVLRCDGCVLDAASVAVREALRNTNLPRVEAIEEGGEGAGNGWGGGGSGGGSSKNDLVVDGDVRRAAPPPGAEACPLVVTVSVLSAPPSALGATKSKSGLKRRRHVSIVDARTEEEACASSRVCVSVDPNGAVCGVHTLGGGGVALEEPGEENGSGSSLPLSMLGDVVASAAKAAGNLYALLDSGGRVESGEVEGSTDDGCGYGYLLKNHFLIQ
ncbi:hypothetical protein ACHAWF_016507 [Thalassiosira exigua]